MKLIYCLVLVTMAVALTNAESRCHQTYKDRESCNADADCVWCLCGALPSACFSIEESDRLPPAVFNCNTKTPNPALMAFIKSFRREFRQQP